MNDDMLRPAVTRTVPNSRLTCAQCERMVLDAIDGTLLPEDKGQFDLHIAGCPSCSRAMEEAQKGAAWLSLLKTVPPEPAPELLQRILAQTSGNPDVAIPVMRGETILGAGRPAYPAGHMAQVLPFQAASPRNWASRAMHAMAQPRFAMTAAMAFFSIALTMNLTGVQLSNLRAGSLTPSNLRHTFWAANARVFRYYDSLRIVYELESRVRELQRQDDDREAAPKPVAPAPQQQPAPGKTKDRQRNPTSSNPVDRKSHMQAVVGRRSAEPILLSLRDCSQTVSATGKRGEGARAWTA